MYQPGRRVSLETPEVAEIDYLYDFVSRFGKYGEPQTFESGQDFEALLRQLMADRRGD
jgi:hypothetical protein